MALVDIEQSELSGLKPQVESHVSQIFAKMGILINQKLVSQSIEITKGHFEDFFAPNRRAYMLTNMLWDGKPGRLIFLNSIELSIIVAAFMMGLPSPTIKEKIAVRQLDDELKEAYNEVSNQLWGTLNQLYIAKVSKDIHLSLEKTAALPENGSQNAELIENLEYLFIKVNTKVGEFDVFPFVLMLSTNIAQEVFHLGGSVGSAASGAVAIGGDLGSVTCGQIMIKDFLTVDIEKSIGDAYDAMVERDVDSAIVLENSKVKKVITKNNIEIIRSVFFEAPGQEERISRLMCLPLVHVNEGQVVVGAVVGDSVKKVVQDMVARKVNTIPVLSDTQELEGVVTAHLVLALLAKE